MTAQSFPPSSIPRLSCILASPLSLVQQRRGRSIVITIIFVLVNLISSIWRLTARMGLDRQAPNTSLPARWLIRRGPLVFAGCWRDVLQQIVILHCPSVKPCSLVVPRHGRWLGSESLQDECKNLCNGRPTEPCFVVGCDVLTGDADRVINNGGVIGNVQEDKHFPRTYIAILG